MLGVMFPMLREHHRAGTWKEHGRNIFFIDLIKLIKESQCFAVIKLYFLANIFNDTVNKLRLVISTPTLLSFLNRTINNFYVEKLI